MIVTVSPLPMAIVDLSIKKHRHLRMLQMTWVLKWNCKNKVLIEYNWYMEKKFYSETQRFGQTKEDAIPFSDLLENISFLI